MIEEMSENQQYRETVKKKITQYLWQHGRKECTEKAIVEFIASDDEVQENRKARKYKMSEDAYGDTPDTDFYRGIVRSVLEELRRNKEILKIAYKNGRNKYAYIPAIPKPIVNDLFNDEIAIFHVHSGDVKDVKNAIRRNLEDKNIIIIPVDRFLFCTMKNPRNYVRKESQLPYIRKQVRLALRSVDYKVRAKAASEDYTENK